MKIKVVMFTDREDSVAHAAKYGDAVREKISKRQEKITHEVASIAHGIVVKSSGDGHLLTFDSAFDAIRAGLLLIRKVRENNSMQPEPERFQLRIGIDGGDVRVEPKSHDVITIAVDIAARIQAVAEAGAVMFTERVHRLLRPGYVECEPLKESVKVKGISEEIKLFRAVEVNPEELPIRERLAEATARRFLQVLLPKIKLMQRRGQRCLEVTVTPELEVVSRSSEKRSLSREFKEDPQNRDALIKFLDKTFQSESDIGRDFNCSKWPLRYSNGGVLPIIEAGGHRFFCLFYRETSPIGWNLANGGSDNPDEMLDPVRVIRREFGEELLVLMKKNAAFYAHDPGEQNKKIGFQKEAIRAWAQKYPARNYLRNELRDFSDLKWIDGPDTLIATVGEDEGTTNNCFISITPEDNAIEIDRIAYLKFTDDFVLLDGEVKNKKPIGRIVGLFRYDSIKKKIKKSKRFEPDRFFFEGEEKSKEEFRSVVEQYRSIRETSKQNEPESKDPFNLCPITHAVLTRFFDCVGNKQIQVPW